MRCRNTFFLFAFVVTSIGHVRSCSSFNKIEVEITPKGAEPFNAQVEGCIQRQQFSPDVQVQKVGVVRQAIFHLKRGSAENMAKLTDLTFIECPIQSVQPGAFRNLPRVKRISVKSSKIGTLPDGVFANLPSLVTIRLDNNKIGTMGDLAFANIPTLREIYCSKNKLRSWNNRWFTNSTAVELLDFHSNLLTTLPSEAFVHMRNLTQIWLHDNHIAHIEPGAFEGLLRVERLKLSRNRLVTINPNAFPLHFSIYQLELTSNRLNFLGSDLLDKLSIEKILLHGNPWKCPCLDRIIFWMQQNNGTILQSENCDAADIPVCVYPKTYSQTCLDIADEEATQLFDEQVRKVATNENKACFQLD